MTVQGIKFHQNLHQLSAFSQSLEALQGEDVAALETKNEEELEVLILKIKAVKENFEIMSVSLEQISSQVLDQKCTLLKNTFNSLFKKPVLDLSDFEEIFFLQSKIHTWKQKSLPFSMNDNCLNLEKTIKSYTGLGYLNFLSKDTLNQVISYLSPYDLIHFESVSTNARDLARMDSLWKDKVPNGNLSTFKKFQQEIERKEALEINYFSDSILKIFGQDVQEIKILGDSVLCISDKTLRFFDLETFDLLCDFEISKTFDTQITPVTSNYDPSRDDNFYIWNDSAALICHYKDKDDEKVLEIKKDRSDFQVQKTLVAYKNHLALISNVRDGIGLYDLTLQKKIKHFSCWLNWGVSDGILALDDEYLVCTNSGKLLVWGLNEVPIMRELDFSNYNFDSKIISSITLSEGLIYLVIKDFFSNYTLLIVHPLGGIQSRHDLMIRGEILQTKVKNGSLICYVAEKTLENTTRLRKICFKNSKLSKLASIGSSFLSADPKSFSDFRSLPLEVQNVFLNELYLNVSFENDYFGCASDAFFDVNAEGCANKLRSKVIYRIVLKEIEQEFIHGKTRAAFKHFDLIPEKVKNKIYNILFQIENPQKHYWEWGKDAFCNPSKNLTTNKNRAEAISNNLKKSLKKKICVYTENRKNRYFGPLKNSRS